MFDKVSIFTVILIIFQQNHGVYGRLLAPVPLVGTDSEEPFYGEKIERLKEYLPEIINEPSIKVAFIQEYDKSSKFSDISKHLVASKEASKDSDVKLTLLRKYMAIKSIDAYIVPSNDEHQNEFVNQADKRRTFISGFTGSSGIALISAESAVLWTDGRYHLQAIHELNPKYWTLMKSGLPGVPNITTWIKQNLVKSQKIGLYANIVSYNYWKNLVQSLGTNYTVTLLPKDLIDVVWDDLQPNRPTRTENSIFILPTKFSGETWKNKVAGLRQKLTSTLGVGASYAFLITGLDEIAWLLNLRGSDILYNPVFYAYCVVTDQDINLFVNPSKLNQSVVLYLETYCQQEPTFCINITPYNDMYTYFTKTNSVEDNQKILFSPTVNMRIYATINSSKVTFIKNSPIRWMKVIKNPVEMEGMKQAQYRDSVALIDFLSFLEEEVKSGKEWDELSITPVLENFRSKQLYFQGLSFETISGFGPNSAIIHYSPTEKSKIKITRDGIFLLDSGAQYLDGTTDVTRSFHFGEPTPFQKEAYTRVLMGVINLASLVFPNFISGRQIDVVARQPLWALGLDFRHGTGHGIGAFLNVHEDPIYIGVFGHKDVPFRHGMFVSDEPGFYLDNEFGIRLETIMMAKNATTKYNVTGENYLAFEAATLVPFEPNLITYQDLGCDQLLWLEAYNKQCEERIKPALIEQKLYRALKWFNHRVQPLAPILQNKGCILK